MPLLVHGEVTHADVDIFDREARFIDTVLKPLRQRSDRAKAVPLNTSRPKPPRSMSVTATTTGGCHHYALNICTFNRNDMLVGGIRPHLYCLPILNAIFTSRRYANRLPVVLRAFPGRIQRRIHVIVKRPVAAALVASTPLRPWQSYAAVFEENERAGAL